MPKIRKRKRSEGSRKSKDNPNQDQVTLLLIVLGILIILLIIAKIFSIIQMLNTPWHLSSENGVSHAIDTAESQNIIFASFPNKDKTAINVVNINPANKQITVLKLSDQIYTQLPEGLGSWSVGSAYQLGEQNNKKLGPKLLSQTIQKLLGLPIDGMIITPDKLNENIDQTLSGLRSNRFGVLTMIPQLKSTLSPLSLYQVLWEISQTRADNVNDLDLATSNVTQSKLLPDNSRVLGVDTVKLDLFVRQNMVDTNLSNEGKTVAVLNGTSHPGLTEDVSRLITNLGSSVIITGNTENPVQKSFITAQDTSSLTYRRLAQIYAPQCLKTECQSNDLNVKESRADITLVLGEDYYDSFYAPSK